MPLIQHSPEFLAKQARQKEVREKAQIALNKAEIKARREALKKEQANIQLQEHIATLKKFLPDEKVIELLIDAMHTGKNFNQTFTSKELTTLFELTREARINPELSKKLFAQHPMNLFTEFEDIQEKLQYNLQINKYIENSPIFALNNLRKIEARLKKYLKRHKIIGTNLT